MRLLVKYAGLLVLVMIWGPAATCQTKSRSLTKAETSQLKSRLNSSLIQGLAGPVVLDPTQQFEVSGTGFETFWMGPVRYESKNPNGVNTSPRCGVFAGPPHGPLSFVPTLGYGLTDEEICGKLLGAGFLQAGKEATPLVLLLYAANIPPRDATRDAVVLRWDSAGKRFLVDEKLGAKLGQGGEIETVAELKRAVKALLR